MTIPSGQPEVWLRGPVPDIPTTLQPVAHALLQVLEDVRRATSGMSAEDVWKSVGGAATVGFHIRHLTGSLDRLLTYARGEMLSDVQLASLAGETEPDTRATAAVLLRQLELGINNALEQLRNTDPSTLTDARGVGRAGLPSSVLGLLYHAGEHSARHAGQVVTTARIIRGSSHAPAWPPK